MGNKQGRQGRRQKGDETLGNSSSNPVGVSVSQTTSPVSGTPIVDSNHFNPTNQTPLHSGSTLQPMIGTNGTKPTVNTNTVTDVPPVISPAADALPVGSLPADKPLDKLPVPADAPINDEYYSEKFKIKIDVDDFELLKVVGKGSFGKVMQVRKKDNGKIYAMKVLKKQQLIARKQVAHTKTERKVLEEIDHPFIVSLRYAFQTESKLYMILDYFTGGELFFHLKSNGRFTEERARFYAAEITLALECLHQHTIVYRDLKPENVLLDEEGHIRLTDFGLSKEGVSHTVMTHTFCGTPEYLAPEVIHGAGYGLAVDWWSLGTLLYEMLTGLPPFYNQNLHVMYEKIIRAKLHFPAYLSPEAKSILTALLERNPKARLGGGGTPNDADEVKKHPFFAGIDWNALYNKRVTAPFRPTTTEGALDVTNVDDEFKKETPKDTPVIPSTLRSKGGSINFPGFSFAPPESMMAASTLASATHDL